MKMLYDIIQNCSLKMANNSYVTIFTNFKPNIILAADDFDAKSFWEKNPLCSRARFFNVLQKQTGTNIKRRPPLAAASEAAIVL